MYIYIDVLIITNIYVDFLLLKATAVLTHSPLRVSRGIAAAFLGGISSLIILLPRLNPFILVTVKLITAAVIVLTAFGFPAKRGYLLKLFLFFLISFIFSGIGTAASYLLGGKFIRAANGVIYADFSMYSLVISTVAAYICVCVYRMLSDGRELDDEYTLVIGEKGRHISIPAALDTGNVLRDSFTGKPIIVCPCERLGEIYEHIPTDISASDTSQGMHGWRFIPYSTALGEGLMPIISPKEMWVKNRRTGEISRPNAYIGAASGQMVTAVFNPKIL
ncbi:MAG: sigma-E processing peptidase SpoIIGA [Oscillospiraceae bacterium]|nr:sigma-E processing peptidase SpoIIGA [Oscillospiraceae bacterium]